MDGRTLNPMGSDAIAMAEVIAPHMTGTLTAISEWIGIVVATLSVALLVAVVWAVQLDFEVVAVTPGGAMVPLTQLDKKNEQVQRALLAANTPAALVTPPSNSQVAAGAAGGVGATASNPGPAVKPESRNATTRKRATQE